MQTSPSKFRRCPGGDTTGIFAAIDAIWVPTLQAKRLLVMIRDIFEYGGDSSFRRARCKNAADLSAAIRRYQLDFLRLGRAALFYADHHLRVRALFRHPCGVRSGQRTGAVG